MARVSLRFKFRVGRTSGLTGFSSQSNPAISAMNALMSDRVTGKHFDTTSLGASSKLMREVRESIEEVLRLYAASFSQAQIEQAIIDAAGLVSQDLEDDIDAYARLALKFFFTRQSSDGDKPLQIGLDQTFKTGRTAGFQSGILWSGTQGDLILWAPLSKNTLKRKARSGNRNTYFRDSGKLFSDMQVILPDFFKAILNPGLRVVFRNEKVTGHTDKKIRVADIEPVIATEQVKGLSPSKVSFLQGKVVGSNPMNTALLRTYLDSQLNLLNEDLLDKLENRSRLRGQKAFDASPRPQRPWVEPAMSYYVLRRFPYTFQRSVRERVVKQLQSGMAARAGAMKGTP